MSDLRSDSMPLPEVNINDVPKQDEDESICHKPQQPAVMKNARVVHISNSSGIYIGPFQRCPDPASVRTPPPGSMNNINFPNTRLPPKSHTEALLDSNRELELCDLDDISPQIGYMWRELGRKMGYSPGQLDNIDADNPTLSDKAYKLCILWRDRESSMATVSNLSKYLYSAKIYDAARVLKP